MTIACARRRSRDLTTALRITGDPAFAVVRRWPASIAQPELGHGEIVDRVAELERSLPGLTIAGNFVTGIAVGSARRAACAPPARSSPSWIRKSAMACEPGRV